MLIRTEEERRLKEDRERKAYWRRWGPYLSERQWGTVREDYSPDGNAWDYFPHDDAPSRTYRWGEDGIAGISDNHQRLCFAIALWNGKDPILKERLFGLNGHEGNHGEDVKEYYYYLDNTPSHAYMKCLYRYPQSEFPYEKLREENKKRTRKDPEYELVDTGIFDEDKYFDIFVEYGKKTDEEIVIKITAWNRGPEKAPLHLIPTLWFRNTWTWFENAKKPNISKVGNTLEAIHPELGTRLLHVEDNPHFLFTDNETGKKDAFHRHLIQGEDLFQESGTKVGLHYFFEIGLNQSAVVHLCLSDQKRFKFEETKEIITLRKREADAFYETIIPPENSQDRKNLARQAFAGLLWTKQWYHYVVERWLDGDPTEPKPPEQRKNGRNCGWTHLYNDDILSMPDKWEYPWFASWDTAFHCIPISLLDFDFAKNQLKLLSREWYMHPNGEIPAYEWDFSDVNPPVHAWSAWRLYQIERARTGQPDLVFLERVFQKLLLNFTWWVNREDVDGKNLFQGGFLGLDNISVFDRSSELPKGGRLNQSDGTSWMGMYCLNMLTIALELAQYDESYEDIASKFFEHFLHISDAMTNIGNKGLSLWDDKEGFFFDVIQMPDGSHFSLKVHSFVSLIPLFAVMTIEENVFKKLPNFNRRLEWFLNHRENLCSKLACMRTPGTQGRRLLSIVDQDKLKRILSRVLDETAFLSEYGVRSLSAYHRDHPYILDCDGQENRVGYEPAESSTKLFGGNSNWRGPIWYPVNYLLIESIQKYHYYHGDDLKIECPTNSGRYLNLWEVSLELSQRLIKLFLKDPSGKRPVYKNWPEKYQNDPYWRDYIQFHEYFHGDTGAGLGASHQTGWTGLIAKMIQQCSKS